MIVVDVVVVWFASLLAKYNHIFRYIGIVIQISADQRRVLV